METIGQHDLTELIAEGGMGTVYKGRHRLSGEVVAIKLMPKHLLSNPVYLKRFEQEYTVARAIDHPNIVRALDFGWDDGRPYLVMELVEGESVGQRIERCGRLPEAEAIDIITQVAQGLQKAHQLGLIHRDVKPDNILVTAAGVAKLTDLGLVKELDADLNLTRTGRGLGTPHFMAPEQFRNAKKADVRCDLYSLGASLYQMVTGELPFRSKGPLDAWMRKMNNEIAAPRQLVPELSERVDWAIRRAMSPQPVHRPENCREFIDSLTGANTQQLTDTDLNIDGPDLWHVVYADESGVMQKVKGTTANIRRSLQTGALGDPAAVRITPTLDQSYLELDRFAEFRDLARPPQVEKAETTQTVYEPEPLPPPQPAPRSSPHIPLSSLPSGSLADEVWKWVAIVTIAISVGMLGYVYMPVLLRWRWL